MTRTTLAIFALLAAGAVLVVVASALGVPSWWCLPAVPLTWYGLIFAGRAAHAAWVRFHVTREMKRGGGPFVRALSAWAAVPKVSGGEAWFTRTTSPAADLEHAVLFPESAGTEEDAVLADLNAATPESRRALVAGLRDLEDLAVDALGSPLHPLFAEAEGLLALVGHPAPRLLGHLRAEAAWRRRRDSVDPDAAEEAIAVRLLLAGLPASALAALSQAKETPRSQRLRRLARFLALLRRSDAVGAAEYASWAPELVLVAGRELPELVPGSAFLASVKGGAAELERLASRAADTVAGLVTLSQEVRELAPLVRQVLGRILAHRAEPVAGEDDGAADRALVAHLRGLALWAEGRPREAIGEFEAALERAPAFAAAAYSLAVTRRRLGAPAAARDELREFARRRAADPEAQLLLARFLGDEGRHDEAAEVFEETIARFPHSLALRVGYAQALASWGRDTDAAEQIEAAHTDHPLDPRLALWAGRTRVHGGRSGDAVRPLRLAADRLQGTERAEAMFWLLAAYRNQGRHDKALPVAVRLVPRLGRGQETMLDELAEYFEERHRFLEAREAADRARRLRGAW